jgi:hypothetical protein
MEMVVHPNGRSIVVGGGGMVLLLLLLLQRLAHLLVRSQGLGPCLGHFCLDDLCLAQVFMTRRTVGSLETLSSELLGQVGVHGACTTIDGEGGIVGIFLCRVRGKDRNRLCGARSVVYCVTFPSAPRKSCQRIPV